MSNFLLINPTQQSTSTEALYVVSRDAFYDHISLQNMTESDLALVNEACSEQLYAQVEPMLQTAISSSMLHYYSHHLCVDTSLCIFNQRTRQLIGFLLYQPISQVDDFRRKFDIDAHLVCSEHAAFALLQYMHVKPSYQNRIQHILLEMMMITNKSALLYATCRNQVPISILHKTMVSTKPKRQ